MPELYMNSFYNRGSQEEIGLEGPASLFFHWTNDPEEDQAFEAYIDRAVRWSEPVVHRGGPEPELSWYDTATDTSLNRLIGSDESYWHYLFLVRRPSGTLVNEVAKFSGLPPGYWRSDQYGRPLDLDEFVVAGLPQVLELTGSVSSARALTLSWQAEDAYVAYEVHEFLKVPESTLKATVTEPTRVSGALAANQTLQYAARGKTSTDELGPFSESVIVTITSNGGTVEPGGPAPL